MTGVDEELPTTNWILPALQKQQSLGVFWCVCVCFCPKLTYPQYECSKSSLSFGLMSWRVNSQMILVYTEARWQIYSRFDLLRAPQSSADLEVSRQHPGRIEALLLVEWSCKDWWWWWWWWGGGHCAVISALQGQGFGGYNMVIGRPCNPQTPEELCSRRVWSLTGFVKRDDL